MKSWNEVSMQFCFTNCNKLQQVLTGHGSKNKSQLLQLEMDKFRK